MITVNMSSSGIPNRRSSRGGDDGSPAAVADSLAAAYWVRADAAALGVARARPAVGGDSAGGNLAAVTSLSIKRAVGLMMGAWFLFSAFGEIIAGRTGTWASIDPNADGSFDVAGSLAVYSSVFSTMMWIGLAAGVLMFVLTPVLKRLMRE